MFAIFYHGGKLMKIMAQIRGSLDWIEIPSGDASSELRILIEIMHSHGFEVRYNAGSRNITGGYSVINPITRETEVFYRLDSE